MRVELNNSVVLDGQGLGGMYLAPPIQGLSIPPIRTADGQYSGRDGGWVASQFFSSREIVINGSIYGSGCEQLDQLRCELTNSLPIRQSIPFVYVSQTGQRYLADTYLRDLDFDIIS